MPQHLNQTRIQVKVLNHRAGIYIENQEKHCDFCSILPDFVLAYYSPIPANSLAKCAKYDINIESLAKIYFPSLLMFNSMPASFRYSGSEFLISIAVISSLFSGVFGKSKSLHP